MDIAVVGIGYVGLVAAVCLADHGNRVTGVDNDPGKVRSLQAGRTPFFEPQLDELLERNLKAGRLGFTSDLARAVDDTDIVFVTVGTPQQPGGAVDTSQVESVCRAVALSAGGPKILVLKSTVPVGTGDAIQEQVKALSRAAITVVTNPEFLKEGAAVNDFLRPDRVVLGGESGEAIAVLRELYAPFVRTGKPVLVMDRRSAEMTKYAANFMLAARISLMNEVAALCERVGADVDQVRKGVGADGRIGPAFLFPGLGYGGSCFPKDLQGLISMGRSGGVLLDLAEAVQRVNDRQGERFVATIEGHFGSLSGRPITVWGLAFKPGTDDVREAPAITVIEGLLGRGAVVTVFDPQASPTAQERLGDRVAYANDQYASARGADGLVLATEWNCFRNPDWGRLRREMQRPVIFDGRNIYDPAGVRRLGFSYYGVGRP